MENRYYVKIAINKDLNKLVEFMIEADNTDQIRKVLDSKHEVLRMDWVD
tara:strand:+ start:2129 stop:2275 length:147 start_codon:yes stop_codon:yes gene_type:complete